METRNANDFPVCLGLRDAMRLTGWSRTMTYRMLNRPETGAFTVGHRKFFHRDRLMQWLDNQTQTANGGTR